MFSLDRRYLRLLLPPRVTALALDQDNYLLQARGIIVLLGIKAFFKKNKQTFGLPCPGGFVTTTDSFVGLLSHYAY